MSQDEFENFTVVHRSPAYIGRPYPKRTRMTLEALFAHPTVRFVRRKTIGLRSEMGETVLYHVAGYESEGGYLILERIP